MRELKLTASELGEMSRALLERAGAFEFEARGLSMRPAIRHGDLITVQAARADALRPGDIAFYLVNNARPAAHRVLGMKQVDGQGVLKVRGDASLGPCEWIRPDDVCGRVVRIRRGSRVMFPARPGARAVALARVWLRGAARPLSPARMAAALLHGAQRARPYRRLARAVVGRRVECRPAQAEEAPCLTGMLGETGDADLAWPGGRARALLEHLDAESQAAVAVIGDRLVGAAAIVPAPDGRGDWWLIGPRVRRRYRGAGIGERLVATALQQARARGVKRLNVAVPEHNAAARGLSRKMGAALQSHTRGPDEPPGAR